MPLLSAVLHAAQVIALDLGHKAISLPSTYQGDLLLSVRNTLYLSGARAERVSRLGWVVVIPEVGFVVLYYYSIILKTCVVILPYLMRTVHGDPSNMLMLELLASF